MKNSIEEDIKILEKFKNNEMQRDKLERDVRCGGWKIGDIYKCLELDNAIDNILSDYKRVLKENEELKILKDDIQDKRIIYIDTPEFEENFISKQKVKDKIEELKKEGNYRTIDNPYGRVHFMTEGCDYKIQVLQELIEEREEK